MNKKHVFFYLLLRPLVRIFLWFKFGYTCTVADHLPENYIVLANHATDYDPLFVASSFPRQMYFVGSEHISRWKFAYKLLRYAFDPIMRPKGTVAVSTTMDVLRRIRAGANVCIFAEGARTWDGVTQAIVPSTGKTVKSARCGLVTYKIAGGYFASPNWSGKNTRRGYVHGQVVNVYTKEQIAKLTVDEINEIIADDLYEDAYARQMKDPKPYRGKRLAEKLENLLFICPECGKVDTLYSSDDKVICRECGLTFSYDEYGMFRNAPFKTVREFAQWQREEVREAVRNRTTYQAPHAKMIQVVNHQESLAGEGELILSQDFLICGEKEIPLEQILGMSRHGKRALVFSTVDAYYEILVSEGANALKFLLLYYGYSQRVKAE